MNAAQAARFLRAFGDGTRLRILAALSRRALSVSRLADLLGCPLHRTSRHLRYLEARGVVECRSEGNSMVYRLAPPQHGVHKRMVAAALECVGSVEEVREDAARLRRSK